MIDVTDSVDDRHGRRIMGVPSTTPPPLSHRFIQQPTNAAAVNIFNFVHTDAAHGNV